MFEELLKQIPVGDIAKQLGVSKSEAQDAIEHVLPSLIGGMAANAQDEKGAKSLAKALGQHEGRHKDLDDVDPEDGERIVNHVFGSKKNEVVMATSAKSSASGDLISKILPIVAPIALAWLANKFLGGKDEPAKKEAQETGGGLGDMLGGLVGGLLSGGGSASGGAGDLLGDVLGGFLGGKK